MKNAFWLLFSLTISLALLSVGSNIIADYQYDKQFGQYLKLADDSSTASSKLVYFKQYREAVAKIDREDAAYVLKQKQFTKSEQLKILDTLIERLEDTAKMDPKSFEYQQAMYQISGQEFNHTLERIDGIFASCYSRTDEWSFKVNLIWYIILGLSIITLFLGVRVYNY